MSSASPWDCIPGKGMRLLGQDNWNYDFWQCATHFHDPHICIASLWWYRWSGCLWRYFFMQQATVVCPKTNAVEFPQTIYALHSSSRCTCNNHITVTRPAFPPWYWAFWISRCICAKRALTFSRCFSATLAMYTTNHVTAMLVPPSATSQARKTLLRAEVPPYLELALRRHCWQFGLGAWGLTLKQWYILQPHCKPA